MVGLLRRPTLRLQAHATRIHRFQGGCLVPALRVCRLLALLLPAVLLAHRVRAEEPPRPDAEAAGLVPAKLARIEAFLQDAVYHKLIGGGVALVARHGKLGYLKAAGWRDVENKTPMTTD